MEETSCEVEITEDISVDIITMPFNIENLISAMEEEEDEGYTIDEIVKKWKKPRRTVTRKIRELLDGGRCKRGFATRLDIQGRQQRIPVYMLVENNVQKPEN